MLSDLMRLLLAALIEQVYLMLPAALACLAFPAALALPAAEKALWLSGLFRMAPGASPPFVLPVSPAVYPFPV